MLATRPFQHLAPKTMLRLVFAHATCISLTGKTWNHEAVMQWLTYWVVYGGLTSAETIVQSLFA